MTFSQAFLVLGPLAVHTFQLDTVVPVGNLECLVFRLMVQHLVYNLLGEIGTLNRLTAYQKL